MKVNVNQFIEIKLTNFGEKVYKDYLKKLRKKHSYHFLSQGMSQAEAEKEVDIVFGSYDRLKNNKLRMQLHNFMRIFGRKIYAGADLIIENNNIFICKE